MSVERLTYDFCIQKNGGGNDGAVKTSGAMPKMSV